MSSPGAVSSTNLDLSRVETDDYSRLVQDVNNFYQQDSTVKNQLTWHWERVQLFLDGKHWVVYEGDALTGGMWKKLNVSESNKYIPRPVTNYIYDSYQTLKSYVIKNKPRSAITPNTPTNKDKNAAKIGNLILDCNWERLHEEDLYETAAANLITYGTIFKKSYWDTSAINMVKVPKMQMVPVTDPNTGMQVGETQAPVFDPVTKEQQYDMLPLGDVSSYIVEPHRMALDPLAMHLHEAKWIMEYSIQPLSWIKETYGKEGEGYTGKAVEVKPEKNLNQSLRRWFTLKTSSGVKDSISSASTTASSDVMVDNSAVVKEYYERPSAENPKGRLIVVAGEECVFSGPSPYEGNEQGDWHPYSCCRAEIVPGRFWGKSPLDEAIEVQKRINSIDATVVLTRKTQAIPQRLIPIGCGIVKGQSTGRPGQEYFYRPGPGGEKPENMHAAGVDGSVFQERAQCVEDLRNITGAIDILKGDRPPGVNAASALSLLYEVGTGKLYPLLDRWKKFVESDQKKQLKLIGRMYKEPRPEFIRMVKSKNTDLSDFEIDQFIGSDLYDNFNVVVEAGSNVPKLQAAHQARLMELAQAGFLNLQNAANRVQFQQEMGIIGYDSDIEPDRKRAQWENDLLDNIQNSPEHKPIVLEIDKHAFHIEEHETRMKSPAFIALPIEVQMAYMQHIQEHRNFQQQQLMAQMLQMQAMAPQMGAKGPMGGPKPMPGAAPAPQPMQQPHGGSHINAGPGGPSAKQTPGLGGPGLPHNVKSAVFGADLLNSASIESQGH